MQFKELVVIDHHEEVFQATPGSRFSKYNTTDETNAHMEQFYPLIHKWFEQNTEVCHAYLQTLTDIRCQYVLASPNILGNYKGVREQYMHTDYKPK